MENPDPSKIKLCQLLDSCSYGGQFARLAIWGATFAITRQG